MRCEAQLHVLLLTAAAAAILHAATARPLLSTADSACSSLGTTSLLMAGNRLADPVSVSTPEACCQACAKQAGCQMWHLSDGSSCELFGLGKGPVTWSIRYKTGQAGVLTSGPSALVEQSSDCDGESVWLFKDVAFDGVVKATAADPYGGASGFRNGFVASTWQECCKGAQQAPGTTVMERSYQYRARQYWTYNQADKKCYVKVRPFQAGATVLTMRRAGGYVSGMFGNEP